MFSLSPRPLDTRLKMTDFHWFSLLGRFFILFYITSEFSYLVMCVNEWILWMLPISLIWFRHHVFIGCGLSHRSVLHRILLQAILVSCHNCLSFCKNFIRPDCYLAVLRLWSRDTILEIRFFFADVVLSAWCSTLLRLVEYDLRIGMSKRLAVCHHYAMKYGTH